VKIFNQNSLIAIQIINGKKEILEPIIVSKVIKAEIGEITFLSYFLAKRIKSQRGELAAGVKQEFVDFLNVIFISSRCNVEMHSRRVFLKSVLNTDQCTIFYMIWYKILPFGPALMGNS
jgi:hypothetical protein